MTARIFFKLIFAVFCLLAAAMTSADFLASRIAETTYVRTLTRELTERCRLLARMPGEDLTRIANRPEVKEALAGREGSSTRLSPTRGVKYLYVAVPISSGAPRLAVPLFLYGQHSPEISELDMSL